MKSLIVLSGVIASALGQGLGLGGVGIGGGLGGGPGIGLGGGPGIGGPIGGIGLGGGPGIGGPIGGIGKGPVHAPVHGGYHEPEKFGPAHYEYKYGIDAIDGYGNPVYYGQNEARNDYSTIGEYHVALPDGRLQTVTYKVDDAYSGVIMDVKYSDYGKPHEPIVHKPIHKAPIVHKPIYHA